MMWGKTFTQSQFVDLLGRLEQKRPAVEIPKIESPESSPGSQSMWVLWSTDPGKRVEWPNVIIVADGQEIEFLAWTATFLPGFRPFTSFFRVLSWFSFTQFHISPTEVSLDGLDDVFVGAILGEAMTYTRSRTSFEALAIQAFASTYSFSMARAIALQLPVLVVDSIGASWEKVRDLSGQPQRKPNVKQLDEVWNIVRCLTQDSDPQLRLQSEAELILLRACRELQRERSLSKRTWTALTSDRIDYERVNTEMSERKEDRVRLFEALVSQMPSDSGVSLTASFVCGFLASLVSQGTLDHADLIFPVLDRFPTALMWYSVCVGLQPSSRLQSYGYGLGRRLLRDVLRPDHLFSRPHADVAIDELQVFSNSRNQQVRIHQRNSTSLSVEIAPMVTVPLRSASDKQALASSPVASAETAATISVLTEMGRSLEKVQKLHRVVIDHLLRQQPPAAEREPPRKTRKRKGWLFPE
jgi:hypothetical protein